MFYQWTIAIDTVGIRIDIIGPGLVQLDMSIIKNTKITERLAVQFRWEVFNVLNRGNFNYLPNLTANVANRDPNTGALLPSFGHLTDTAE